MSVLLRQPPLPEPEPQQTADPAQLRAWWEGAVHSLPSLEGDRRETLAGQLNAQLAEVPREGGRPWAEALSWLLDQPELATLTDPRGLRCDGAAAAALVNLGWPHALKVPPEALASMREGARYTPLWVGIPSAVGVTLFAAIEGLVHLVLGDAHAVLHAALAAGSAWGVALTTPRTAQRRTAMALLLGAAAVSPGVALMDAPSAAVTGAVAAASALLMRGRRRR